MLDQLTAEHFTPLLDTLFTITLADGSAYPLTLIEVKITGEAINPGGRKPFSLLLCNPRADAYLPQRIYSLEHPSLGRLDLFLVPLGPDTQGMVYQAVFS